ncbi:DUF6482 family protein [Marinibactrum halimedae]|uniref:Na(+)-translocating NADH-quinone reductase subunit B n=2 Tax=Marinibactrum halimedae TaxID=1444977 RepID=A0AA37TDA2_9GAMM|nr:DUF6482 family protein [Marinibactrum halimedae]GLS27550.1 hypothetical protein GCM10007877_32690 [Marinibactrum halimedae]
MLHIEQLKSVPMSVKCLHIHSHEGGIYLVEMEFDSQREFIAGGNGRPLHFASVEDVRRKLNSCKPEKVKLVHHSAYGEMIGLSSDAIEPMELEIPWVVEQVH